jgi:pantetheine-phosphate adenylyltransferase
MDANYIEQINQVLRKYTIITYDSIQELWTSEGRVYHNLEHLQDLIDQINEWCTKYEADELMKDKLLLLAIFHDAIYDPTKSNNEEQSAEYFKHRVSLSFGADLVEEIYEAILDTQTHQEPSSKISDVFLEMDMNVIYNSSFDELLAYEKKIFQEYQFVNWANYREKRLEFLQSCHTPATDARISHLFEYVKNYQPHIGVYAGSFNPFHKGHMNVVHKSEQLFDKVIVAKGINRNKNYEEKQFQTSLRELKNSLPFREVTSYEGLLTDFIKEQEATGANINLIRGLRNGFDLEAENKLTFYLKDLHPQLKIVYIPCDKELEYINSTDIRMLYALGQDVNKYLP